MSRLISIAELRLGLRLIARQPMMSVTIILALAIGICAAMVGFTAREAVFNSTLPYQAGDRFVRLVAFDRDGNRLNPGIERYHAVRDGATSLEDAGVVIGRTFTVAYGPGDVESIAGASIT